jgi:hypothetical protein
MVRLMVKKLSTLPSNYSFREIFPKAATASDEHLRCKECPFQCLFNAKKKKKRQNQGSRNMYMRERAQSIYIYRLVTTRNRDGTNR